MQVLLILHQNIRIVCNQMKPPLKYLYLAIIIICIYVYINAAIQIKWFLFSFARKKVHVAFSMHSLHIFDHKRILSDIRM